jgi:UDP:flavonoid glycosyltransferase YjiC (YdhE family)
MITHGGMNSIAECIKMEIPMLVFPLSPYWDQPGNSARVIYHGLGLRANIQRDSCRHIENKIERIMRNYEDFKNNLSIMRKNMSVADNFISSWWNLFNSK